MFHRTVQLLLLVLLVVGGLFALRPDLMRAAEAWLHRTVIAKLTGTPADQAAPTEAAPAEPATVAEEDAVPEIRGGGDAAPANTGGATPAASESASSSSSAEAIEDAGTIDTRSCVASLFQPDAFTGTEPDFDSLCSETDPRKGATALNVQIVLPGQSGTVTSAMQEWALLSWYEMAAFVVIRTRCCVDPPRLETPQTLAHCKLDEALDGLAKASQSSDESATTAAIESYATSLQCLYRVGAGSVFGLTKPPQAGSQTAFRKLLERVRTSP